MNDNRKFEIEKVFMLDNLHFKPWLSAYDWLWGKEKSCKFGKWAYHSCEVAL